MILYSTELPLKPSMAKEQFYETVIKWIQGGRTPIRALNNWSGTVNSAIGDEAGNVTFSELPSLTGARFRSTDENGILWTVEAIADTTEGILSVTLQRETTDMTATFYDTFTPPYLIKSFAQAGFIETDGPLAIQNYAHEVNEHNVDDIARIMNGTTKLMLPLIYVSITSADRYHVDQNQLARSLYGIAHVCYERDRRTSRMLHQLVPRNPSFGGVGVFYSNTKLNRSFSRDRWDSATLTNKLIYNLQRYAVQKERPVMHTWTGMQMEMLHQSTERMQALKVKAEAEKDSVYDVFGADLDRYSETIIELNNKVTALMAENAGLRNKYEDEAAPVIHFGEEHDKFVGEITEYVLEAIQDRLASTTPNTRRYDVLQDLVKSNVSEHKLAKNREKVKRLLKNDDVSSVSKELEDIGLTIVSEKGHYKVTYYDDPRYHVTIAKTASDYRSSSNTAQAVIKNMM